MSFAFVIYKFFVCISRLLAARSQCFKRAFFSFLRVKNCGANSENRHPCSTRWFVFMKHRGFNAKKLKNRYFNEIIIFVDGVYSLPKPQKLK